MYRYASIKMELQHNRDYVSGGIKSVTKQVKSKQRVADHGEVFTAEREVKSMCDLVKTETERIDSRFLDKTTPRLIQFHTLKNAANPPFLGVFSIFGTVAA